MLGYIARQTATELQKQVPSLYVRVYREKVCNNSNTKSSLTVCEGISVIKRYFRVIIKFPHCMWGYIAFSSFSPVGKWVPSLYVRVYQQKWVKRKTSFSFPHCMWWYIALKPWPIFENPVPSLYVRVYREAWNTPTLICRSLTVCEGISAQRHAERVKTMFPHCMWGYIAVLLLSKSHFCVPSLYVRVYRFIHFFFLLFFCSLTVCEGVSFVFLICYRDNWCPHCMWGYIAQIFSKGKQTQVPSLYVRVYRLKVSGKNISWCSLIIREGISDEYGELADAGLFPHYTWGYIGLHIALAVLCLVPPLYVRVYRAIWDNW